MSASLLDDLDLSARLMMAIAARQEVVPVRLAMRPPLDEEAAMEAAEALVGRGLLVETELPGLLALSPMGYALVDTVAARWPELHQQMRAMLLAHLATSFGLSHDHAIFRALSAVDRSRFVPSSIAPLADLDVPVPTGVGDMTTSAPHALVYLLKAVRPQPGERVLVCGAKGGMVLALATEMVGAQGSGLAIDWEPATVALVAASLQTHPHLAARAEVRHVPDVTLGSPESGPYDCIILNGSVPKIPRPLVQQLRPGTGRMLMFMQEPLVGGQSCFVMAADGTAQKDDDLSKFAFTPIYGRYGWDRITGADPAS